MKKTPIVAAVIAVLLATSCNVSAQQTTVNDDPFPGKDVELRFRVINGDTSPPTDQYDPRYDPPPPPPRAKYDDSDDPLAGLNTFLRENRSLMVMMNVLMYTIR